MEKPQIDRARFSQSEFKQERYFASIPQDTKPEQLLDPQFFAAVSGMCRVSGIIWCEWEDGTLLAELWIQSVGQSFVLVKMLRCVNLSEIPMGLPQDTPAPEYKVVWRGAHHRHSVVRIKDSQVVSSLHDTKAAADRWLEEHLKAVSR